MTIYIVVGLFIGLQKTKISSVAIVLLSILIIFFSSILVLKFNLNIKGVAYGTLIATGITSLLFLFYIFYYLRKYVSLNFNIKEIVNTSKLKNLLEINLNIFLRTIFLKISYIFKVNYFKDFCFGVSSVLNGTTLIHLELSYI